MKSDTYTKHPVDELFKETMRLWMVAEKLMREDVARIAGCEKSVVTSWLGGRLRTCNIDHWVNLQPFMSKYEQEAREEIRKRNPPALSPALLQHPRTSTVESTLTDSADREIVQYFRSLGPDRWELLDAMAKGKKLTVLTTREQKLVNDYRAKSEKDQQRISNCVGTDGEAKCEALIRQDQPTPGGLPALEKAG
jgi:hypothetical protein